MKFQGCSKKDFRMLQERLKVFQWSFEWVSGELVFEGSLQGVARMFQGRLRGVPKVISVVQGSFKVSRKKI